MQEWIPELRILDGKHIDERFIERRFKRKLIEKLQEKDTKNQRKYAEKDYIPCIENAGFKKKRS